MRAITERRATFTRADLNRHLTEFLPDVKARTAFLDEVLAREAVVPLRETEQAPVSRYTTRAVLDGEGRIIASAARMEKGNRHGVSAAGIAAALDTTPQLDREQRNALHHATQSNGIALIQGQAGTGKSTVLGVIRDAYEADGYTVIGLAPTHTVKEDMKHGGFSRADTLQAELMRQSSVRGSNWNNRTVIILDEASMASSKQLAALLTKAEAAGAKPIICYDNQQFQSIDRGGMLPVLEREHEPARLTTIYRAKRGEDKAAFQAMHSGDFRSALETFDKRGAIHWGKTGENSIDQLVAHWAAATQANPTNMPSVNAYTNAEVDELNQRLRAVRQDRGELGDDHLFQTRRGEEVFADRRPDSIYSHGSEPCPEGRRAVQRRGGRCYGD